jgi:hypothetical protein
MCELEVNMECQRLLETVIGCPRESDNSSAVPDVSCMFWNTEFHRLLCLLFVSAGDQIVCCSYSKILNTNSKLVLFENDTSSLITTNNVNDLHTKSASTLIHIDEWFTVNGLSLNIDKTIVMHFSSNHLQDNIVQISCEGKEIKEVINIKFLGLGLDNHMKWKTHIDLIIAQLSRTCYVIIRMHFLSDISTLKMIHYVYFHSIL